MQFMFTADIAFLIMVYLHWTNKCRFVWWEFVLIILLISLESHVGIKHLKELAGVI